MKTPSNKIIAPDVQTSELVNFIGQALANNYHVKVAQISTSILSFIDYNRQVVINIDLRSLPNSILKANAFFIPDKPAVPVEPPVDPPVEPPVDPPIIELVPTMLEINGDNSIIVLDITENNSTSQFTAIIKDQNGDIMSNEEVEWSINPTAIGISIDNNGLVTVVPETIETEFTLVATSATDSTLFETKTVTLTLESDM